MEMVLPNTILTIPDAMIFVYVGPLGRLNNPRCKGQAGRSAASYPQRAQLAQTEEYTFIILGIQKEFEVWFLIQPCRAFRVASSLYAALWLARRQTCRNNSE